MALSQLYVDPVTQKRYTERTLRVYNIDPATVQPLAIVKPPYNAQTHQLIDLQTASQDNAGNYLVDFEVRLKPVEQFIRQLDLKISLALNAYLNQSIHLSDDLVVINTPETLAIFKAILMSKLPTSNTTFQPIRPCLQEGNFDHITTENAQAKLELYLSEIESTMAARNALASGFRDYLNTLSSEDFLVQVGSQGQLLAECIGQRHLQLYAA